MDNLIELIAMSRPLQIAIFGSLAGVIAIATSIAQWYDQRDSEKEKIAYQDSIRAANAEIISLSKLTITLQQKVLDTSEKTIHNTEKIAALAEENARLQEELKNQVTGGDSHPVLNVFTSPNSEYIGGLQLIDFYFTINGKYPLTQVKAKIQDSWGGKAAAYVGRPLSVGGAGLHFYDPPRDEQAVNWETVKDLNLGTIQPEQNKELYYTSFVPVDIGHGKILNDPGYTIDVEWPSGFVRYMIVIEFGKGIPILKTVSISHNYKPVKINDYLKFNNWSNMEEHIKVYTNP